MSKMAEVEYFAGCMISRDKWMAHDACDWLSDVCLEVMDDGRRVWDMPADEVAELISEHYPSGATGWVMDLLHGTLIHNIGPEAALVATGSAIEGERK